MPHHSPHQNDEQFRVEAALIGAIPEGAFEFTADAALIDCR